FCIHPHRDKIFVFRASNGAIPAGIRSTGCKLTTLGGRYSGYTDFEALVEETWFEVEVHQSGLLEVVGYEESLRLQLVEPPKILRSVGGKKFFESTKSFRGSKRVWCNHGEKQKNGFAAAYGTMRRQFFGHEAQKQPQLLPFFHEAQSAVYILLLHFLQPPGRERKVYQGFLVPTSS
ncbi:hypothetical protein L195_g052875, partial [Trifolium pratense]